MNDTVRKTAAISGITLAISGLNHGIFEILQGNKPTESLVIPAIGPEMQMWEHGREWAFTLLPTYLSAGIATVLVSCAIIIWCLGYLHVKRGPLAFLLLFTLLSLTGGGIGHVVLFTVAWAFATRIHSTLSGWRRLLPVSFRRPLARTWTLWLVLLVVSFLPAIWIATTGYVPGVEDADRALGITFLLLLLGLLSMVMAYIAAIAKDLLQGEPANQAIQPT